MPGTTGTMALNPMTTGGDIVYGGASGVETRLANGTVGQVLRSGGTTVAPTWATFVAELGGANTWTGVNTFGAAGAVSRLKIAGTTSGSLTLDTDATAGTAVITIPAVTDTLVGKATTDILTNKTLTTPVINGAVTTTGLTLPAVTLGGVVSGGGQQVNNVIIGTVTPLAGAFTTLTGQSLATSAASPLLTNGQLVTVALTSQTTGGVTLTIPDFADVGR